MWYAECLKKYYNAVDGTFYDAISLAAKRHQPGLQFVHP